MRSWTSSFGWTSLALLPILALAAGCGGTPDAPQANPNANANGNGATDTEVPLQVSAPDAAPPVERVPEQAVVETLRTFMYAMVARDQATLESVSLPHPELSMLWFGEKRDAEYLDYMKKEIATIAFHKILPGDKVDFAGKETVIKAADIKENELMVTCKDKDGNDIPFFLEKRGGAWKVHPTPIIASRKAAIAEMEALQAAEEKGTAAQPPVEQPAVQTADQLGTGGATVRPAPLNR